jgi:hypothetical protein
MKYLSILSESFQIFYKHKLFWPLSLLMALLWEASNCVTWFYGQMIRASGGQALPPGLVLVDGEITAAWPRFLLVFFGVDLVVLALAVLAEAPLYAVVFHLVRQAETGPAVSIRQSWQAARGRIWPLFQVFFLIDLPFVLMQGIGVVGTLFSTNLAAAGQPASNAEALARLLPVCSLLCGMLLVWLPLILLNMLQKLASRASVLESLGLRPAIRRGWQLLRHNPGYALLTWLWLGLLQAVFSTLADIPATARWAPVWQTALDRNWSSASLLPVADYLLVYLFFFILLGGLLTGYTVILWCRLYSEFVQRAALQPGAASIPAA